MCGFRRPGKTKMVWSLAAWATRNPQKWITLLIYVFGFTFTTLTVTHSLTGRHGKAIFSEQVVLHPNSANNSNNSAFMIFHDLSSTFRLSPAFCVCPIKAKSWIVTPNQATKVKTSQSIASFFCRKSQGCHNSWGDFGLLRGWPKLPRGHSTVHPSHPWPWPTSSFDEFMTSRLDFTWVPWVPQRSAQVLGS